MKPKDSFQNMKNSFENPTVNKRWWKALLTAVLNGGAVAALADPQSITSLEDLSGVGVKFIIGAVLGTLLYLKKVV